MEAEHEKALAPVKAQLHKARHIFTRRELMDNGWEKTGFYAPGNEDIYTKNGKEIYVFREYDYDTSKYVNTGDDDEIRVVHREWSSPHWFDDMDELNQYVND